MNNDLMRRIYEQICQHKETIIHLQEQSKSHPELFARTIAQHRRNIFALQEKLKKLVEQKT